MPRSKLTDCEYNIANEESCTEEAGVMCSKYSYTPILMPMATMQAAAYYVDPASCLTYTPPDTPTCAATTTSSSPPPDTTSTTSVTCSTPTTCPTCNCSTDYTAHTPATTMPDTTHPLATEELLEGQQSRTDSYTAIGGGLGALAVVLALTLVGVVLGWVWHCRANRRKQNKR